MDTSQTKVGYGTILAMSRRDLSIEPEAILACREYRVESATGSRYLRIAIAFPKKTSDARYECRAEISDDEQCVVRPMTGVDALEALMLALINIGAELQLFVDSTDHFTWLDGHEVGLRFPVLPDYSLNTVIRPLRIG